MRPPPPHTHTKKKGEKREEKKTSILFDAMNSVEGVSLQSNTKFNWTFALKIVGDLARGSISFAVFHFGVLRY